MFVWSAWVEIQIGRGREGHWSEDEMRAVVGHIFPEVYCKLEAGRWAGSWRERDGHHLCVVASPKHISKV